MNKLFAGKIDFLYKLFFILCVFVSPLLFFTDLTRNPFAVQSSLLAFSAGALLLLWACKVFLGGRAVFKYSAADFAFAAFIAAVLLSFFINLLLNPSYAPALLSEFLRKGHTLLTNILAAWLVAKAFLTYRENSKPALNPAWLLLWGVLWLFFGAFKMSGIFDIYAIILWACGIYICFGILRNNNSRGALDIFIAVTALACAYGILQNLGFDIVWDINISYQFGARAVSTFGNPNFLSSCIVLFFPLVFLYFLQADKKGDKFYYAGIVLLFSAYLVISATRSSWLGALAALFIIFVSKNFRSVLFKRKKRAALLLAAALAVFILWPSKAGGDYSSSAAERIRETSLITSPARLGLNTPREFLNPAWHQRLMMWHCAADMFKQSPLTGKGWGGYQIFYAPCQGKLLAAYPQLEPLRTQANAAHNDIFETAAQSGILGLSAYLAVFISLLVLFIKNNKKQSAAAGLFNTALFAGCAAFFADNMLNITMQAPVTAFAFYFVLSSLNLPFCKTADKEIKKPAAAVLVIFCAAVFGLVFIWQHSRITALASDFKAHKFYAQNNYRAASAAAAKAVNSANREAETYYVLINSYLKNNDVPRAGAAAVEAQKYNPHYHEFYLRAAAAASAEGRRRDAVDNLVKLLELYPSYYPAALSFSMLLAEEPALASPQNTELLEGSVKLFPFANEIKFGLAKVLLAKGMKTRSAEITAAALRHDIFDPDALEVFAELEGSLNAEQQKLLLKAREADAIKKLLPGDIAAGKKLENKISAFCGKYGAGFACKMLEGEFYYKNSQPQKALASLLPLYPENENNAALNFALASAYTSAGEPQKASFYLEKILKLNPFNQLARQRLDKLNLQNH